ncbi:hypothetical protein [Xylocopilactobacillus apicola]|uniref:DUF2971 domain-containing protein n=1 Tax=Xylocopilactobacillus apicola TaxID=2932184 RepID=A0AAU9DW56_9LACO|nr:hypothetical protein [Xylocopilactobacillus apicola]BDR59723.1 hypothetical protein XA3_21640 [Xylocopilactobacillus apicola]
MDKTVTKLRRGQHYTSVESFFSIISTSKIRLTRSEFLNDPTDTRISNIFISKFTKIHRHDIAKTVRQIGGSQSQALEEIYQKAPIEKYLRFILNHVNMYVMALTRDSDSIPMWNYYGRGGMELSLDIPGLVADLSSSLDAKNKAYIGLTDVTYVNEQMDLSNMELPQRLGNFFLRTAKHPDIFSRHESFLKNNHFDTSVFDLTNVGQYTTYFITSYIYSLRFLLVSAQTIKPEMTPEEIFRTVYNNDLYIKEKYAWKSDVLLFFLMLSAALKNDSYQFEREIRIVYFNPSLNPEHFIPSKYDVKMLQGQQYIRPYIELPIPKIAQNIHQITLSPQTENLPIDHQAYLEVIKDFLRQNDFEKIQVNFSKRKIRW